MDALAGRMMGRHFLGWKAFLQAKVELEDEAFARVTRAPDRAPDGDFYEFTEDELRAYMRAHNARLAA